MISFNFYLNPRDVHDDINKLISKLQKHIIDRSIELIWICAVSILDGVIAQAKSSPFHSILVYPTYTWGLYAVDVWKCISKIVCWWTDLLSLHEHVCMCVCVLGMHVCERCGTCRYISNTLNDHHVHVSHFVCAHSGVCTCVCVCVYASLGL